MPPKLRACAPGKYQWDLSEPALDGQALVFHINILKDSALAQERMIPTSVNSRLRPSVQVWSRCVALWTG